MQAQTPLESWLSNAPITRTAFAQNVGCSLPHLTLVAQGKRGASLELALNIERETDRAVTVEQLLRSRQPAPNKEQAG